MIKILELEIGISIKVHSSGLIETMDRKEIRKNGRLDNRKGKILKPKIDKYGYAVVTLTNKGIRKSLTVHRLVAQAFIPNPLNKPTVNHIDGNKLNNDFHNLEWATHKEQKRHSLKNGLSNFKTLQENNAKRSIKVIYKNKKYNSIREAAKVNEVHERIIKKEGVMLNGQPSKNS